ncbi:Domain of unknown function (DUF4380) [Chthonomonas calidirosea]|uniref:DUF4380 domain-containing protein n=1 Tax=Chthonomonas calidirosea (strain DSM 23976 / ICMP 18418 / T49) TaxID=1303518 RepID=S0EU37_CHTCT|nr:DUF4380 domain-containing protein [Chthonomonas calidirosea]CCW35113.1 Domain of unknown function (DUF4380) [Chthonomonas calidirosea T49]CEK20266.1 Domain of unknown function (DUF4380) [Chthonomonas calidirosea]CEK20267.1 Domain of unknown function (DUF4380) [Chthonomonas calidirosea]CEK20870.1 Domain of unknown function (DUF4380) [Chthonomonas calidirosea]
MRSLYREFGVFLLLFFMASASAYCDVSVRQITYAGWQNAYQLSNGDVELVVVPQIGRIMRYGPVGGPNMLWNNPTMLGKTASLEAAAKEWPNFGGDKLWPAPQSVWNWPPDPYLDSAPQTVRVLPNHHLLVIGQASPQSGIRFEREIALAPKGDEVTLVNIMINTSSKPVKWAIWEIFQANDPLRVYLPTNISGHFAEGYLKMSDALPPVDRIHGQLVLSRSHTMSYKVGSDAPDILLRALVSGYTVSLTAKLLKGTYPDGGCTMEVYSNPDAAPYMEMELLAPIVELRPGEQTRFITQWHLGPPQGP